MRRVVFLGLALVAAFAPQAFAGPLNIVQNPGFAFSRPYIFPGHQHQPTDWTISGAGTTPGGSTIFIPGDAVRFWDNGAVSRQGTSGQVAFIQGGGRFSQTLVGLHPGAEYQFSMYVGERDWRYETTTDHSTDLYPIVMPINVSVSVGADTIIGPDPISPVRPYPNTNAVQTIDATFVATNPSEVLVLTAAAPVTCCVDISALFAQPSVVQISNPVPEPSSLLIFVLPLLALLAAKRIGVLGVIGRPHTIWIG